MRALLTPHTQLRCAAIAVCLGTLGLCTSIFAGLDASKLPAATTKQIDFSRDVQPIFETSCYRCHGTERPRAHFSLVTRDAALKGGRNGVDIIPGHSEKSLMIFYVAGLVEDMEMPPADKGAPLTKEQVSILRAWIDQGAQYPIENDMTTEVAVAPTFRATFVSGDSHAFREQFWRRDGLAGGLDSFYIQQQSKNGSQVTAQGHALSDAEDVKVDVLAQKNEVGFVHFDFDNARSYYDDVGGYSPAIIPHSFSLNRDLSLDSGRAGIDFGLTLPDKPQFTLGYEYNYRQGTKSTLEWGAVGTTTVANILPAFKHIDEKTHVLKFGANYDIAGWELGDEARVEFYDLSTFRINQPAPDQTMPISERDRHIQGENTFHVDRRFTDWLSGSGAYYYSQMNGDAAVQANTLTDTGALALGDQAMSQEIVLDRETQAGSVSALAGPWQNFILSSAVQTEWTRQHGLDNALLSIGGPFEEPTLTGNYDDTTVRENVLLRYTGLPFTVFTAETRLQQESESRFESDTAIEPFLRDSDVDVDGQEFRVGVESSPISRITLGADYRHNDKRTDYSTVRSNLFHAYPGFLVARDLTTDTAEARLHWRAANWLHTLITYQWNSSEFNNATAAGGPTPASPIDAGSYLAHIASINVTASPTRKLSLSSTFSFIHSSTVTAQNNAPYLAPWRGDNYSVLSSATYHLDENTDLSVSYIVSWADYGQHVTGGVPAGIVYDRNVVEAGISRRLSRNVKAGLQYGFYKYTEPSDNGLSNFTAHSVFATLGITFE